MYINGVAIEDTFAEAFTMYGARVTITAVNEKWVLHAGQAATGFATSIIGCGVEAGIEGPALDTPDGRPGLNCLFFTTSPGDMEKQLVNRIGQAIMTAPTTACYDGLAPDDGWQEQPAARLKIGSKLRFFGDGYQSSKVINGRRFWRIPVMEGEFLVQEEFTAVKGVGGGNFLILAATAGAALAAAEAAVEAMREVRGVILPFPGGVVRSGSQVGSRYKFLRAATNVAFCPTLRGIAGKTALPPGVNAVLEIVIDGLTPAAVAEAMQRGIRAACLDGVRGISAGNYGGRLGKHLFPLRQVVQGEGSMGHGS